MAEYAVEFVTFPAESECNEVALQAAFRLSDLVRDALVAGERQSDLEEQVNRAVKLENYQREQRRERFSRPVSPRFLVPRQVTQRRTQPQSPSVPHPHEEPMQLERTCLKGAERRRRLASGSCLYCGQGGHYITLCPTRPKD